MKITFSNLGSIKKTTLDLRPLTVIIGPNNSNKTYIAYSIYGLLTSCKNFSSFRSEISIFIKFFQKIEETESQTKRECILSLANKDFINKLVEFINKYIHGRLWHFAFNREINEFFQDTSLKIFSKTNFEMVVTQEEILEAIANVKKKHFEVTSSNGMNPPNYSTLILEDDKFLIHSKSELLEKDLTHAYSTIFGNFLEELMLSLFKNPFLFPAERNAFVMTYKMLATRRYRLLRENQRHFIGSRYENRQFELLKEQGDIRYPQPVEDFLDFLTDIELQPSAIEDSEERLKFHELANKIEINIQGNNRTQFKSTKFGGKEIKINVKKGLDIDLYNASSSIKQLAPLLLYLRYRAKEGDLLIIDEPEMNLHPESQAKLLEVLGMLVNAGVNVLLTTHSPYFMSHLNNLVSGKTDDESVLKEQAKSLYLGDERAFLKMEDVSAYEMKNNKLKDLKDKDYGIRWDTLSDVSADIQQKFFEIYEKGKETSAEDEV